jgi:hypothetical protein
VDELVEDEPLVEVLPPDVAVQCLPQPPLLPEELEDEEDEDEELEPPEEVDV